MVNLQTVGHKTVAIYKAQQNCLCRTYSSTNPRKLKLFKDSGESHSGLTDDAGNWLTTHILKDKSMEFA